MRNAGALRVAVAALLMMPVFAFAQSQTQPVVVTSATSTGANVTQPVGNGAGTSTPMPVTVSGGVTTTCTTPCDVNLKQVGGVATKTGSGTAADVLRVELPTDGTGKVGLNAGSAIVGKVGIDQTTPGTTNAVSIPSIAGAGTTTSASVGTSSAQALATGTRNLLFVQNPSSTANVACNFGGTAALNTAGSIMFPPGATLILDNQYIPNDALNCIASVASSPLTIVTR